MSELEDILMEMQTLPRGSVVYKNIKGNKQPYLQWREDGKVKSKYIKVDEREKIFKQVARRKQLFQLYNRVLLRYLSGGGEYFNVSDDGLQIIEYKAEELVSKKDFSNRYSVNRKFVNSKAFHDKFIELPLSHDCIEKLIKEVGRLLEFTDGLPEERMTAISRRTGERVVDNFDRPGKTNSTFFTSEEYKIIDDLNEQVITIHNHPHNGRASGRDIASFAADENVYLSLVVCPLGDVYAITGAYSKVADIYKDLLEEEKKRFNDIALAKIFATNRLYSLNELKGNRHKLFEIRRL